jgi:hypothetical protein
MLTTPARRQQLTTEKIAVPGRSIVARLNSSGRSSRLSGNQIPVGAPVTTARMEFGLPDRQHFLDGPVCQGRAVTAGARRLPPLAITIP